YGNLNTSLGFASTDINFKTNPETKKTSYSGRLAVNNFNVGKVLDNKSFGNVSFNIALKGSGFKMNELVEEANGSISNIDFNGYSYQNIALNGKFAKKFFRGTISIHEPNADVDFDGIVDLNGKLPEYNFLAVINYLNLDNLKLVQTGREQILRTRMNINVSGNSFENMEGSMLIKDSYFHLDKTLYYVNNIGINSFGFGKGRTFYLRSDFADGEVSGLLDAKHFVSSVNELLSHYIPDAYSIKDLTIYNQNAAFHFKIKNSDLLTQLFAPRLHLETSTELSGKFNSAENIFSLNIISPEISYGNIRFSDFSFNLANDSSKLHADFKTQNISIGAGIKIDLVGLSASAKDNRVDFQLNASDVDTFPNRLNVKGNYTIFSPSKGKVVFEKSSAFISHEEWTLSHENSVDIDSTSIRISGLTLSRDKQFFGLNGVISKNSSDLLEFSFDNFSMANINPLISSSGFEFGGVLDGKFSLSGIFSKLNLQSALTIRNFSLNSDTVGFASVNSTWNDEKQELSASVTVTKGTKKIIDIDGKYFPAAPVNNFDFRIFLNDIYLHPFEKFIDDVFSQLYGKLSGELTLKGSSSDPQLNGKIKITKGNFILNFLNTHYSFTDEISVSPYGFGFNNLILNDENGNTARLNGKLSHHNFKDLTLNLRMDADHFQCINTNYSGTEIYYGTANASGFATLDGPVKSLFIDLNLSSDKGTKIFFPLQSSSENSENSFVTFINKNIPDTVIQSGKVNLNGVTLTSNLELTTDAEIQIIFDEKIGDVIKGRGNGNLKLALAPDGEFSINGNVIIEDGDYLFTLKNVINKKFRIEPGSTVTFSGDPLDADVNLTAIYRTRTYLKDLIPNDSSYLSRQTVDCLLKLSGKLFNPKVKFEVLIPGGDATTQSLVNNVLNNEEEMSKQVISLLVLNSFQPINRGAGAAGNYTGSAGANAGELLSNQFNNWLSQANKDWNFSVNYRFKDAISRDELDLAVSTQQFNDRVSIDLNVG
ncbi:MAG: translocation/assembly module TamB domain-containing protein, partial [Bacteroidia bacterium]|nr:translocation/assembly module TamB domain-containing protein [Bacteroidia bacterium]